MNHRSTNHRKFKKAEECQHIKANGLRCLSPALRERRYCFFHQRTHDLRRLRLRHPNSRIQLPLLEDAESIQIAIQEVADAITQDRIDPRRAGLLLFALQTASSNLKHADFEPKKLREYADPAQQSPIVKLLMDELELWEKSEDSSAPQATEKPPASVSGPLHEATG
jgi:hypothetical protein